MDAFLGLRDYQLRRHLNNNGTPSCRLKPLQSQRQQDDDSFTDFTSSFLLLISSDGNSHCHHAWNLSHDYDRGHFALAEGELRGSGTANMVARILYRMGGGVDSPGLRSAYSENTKAGGEFWSR